MGLQASCLPVVMGWEMLYRRGLITICLFLRRLTAIRGLLFLIWELSMIFTDLPIYWFVGLPSMSTIRVFSPQRRMLGIGPLDLLTLF